jgi:hypothetical protein
MSEKKERAVVHTHPRGGDVGGVTYGWVRPENLVRVTRYRVLQAGGDVSGHVLLAPWLEVYDGPEDTKIWRMISSEEIRCIEFPDNVSRGEDDGR